MPKKSHLTVLISLFTAGLVPGSVAATSDSDLRVEQAAGPKPWTHLRLHNDPADFQFAIVGDRTGGARPGVFEDAVRKLNLLQPEFVMSVGDLIEGYTTDTQLIDRQWKEFSSFVDALQMPFFYVPGNHDHSNEVMAQEWKKRFGRPYYHFVYKDVLFLCLNSEDPRAQMSRQQIDYFRKVLAENRDVRWTLAFLHQPLWASPEVTDDGAVYAGSGWKDFEALLAGRNYTIFAGHLHQYVNAIRDGKKYIILASTGGVSGLRGPRPYGEFDHLMWVTMKEDGPILANLMLDGIRDENIRSERVASLVNPLTRSALRSQTIFVDSGPFTSATTQLRLTNDADLPLSMRVTVSPSGPLRSKPTVVERTVPPNSVEFVDVALVSDQPLDPNELPPPLPLHWSGAYDVEGEPRVEVQGNASIGVDARFPCPRRTRPVQVDGQLEEWDQLPFGKSAVRHASEPWDGPEDCSYRFGAAYDAHYMYVAVNTTDDHLVLRPGRHPWEQDGVEIRVDARPDSQRSRGRGENEIEAFLLFAMSPGLAPGEMTFFKRDRLPAGVQAACIQTSTGLAAEIAIPREYLDRTQKESWRSLRINVAADDVDSEGEKVANLLWWRPDWRSPRSYEGSGTFVRQDAQPVVLEPGQGEVRAASTTSVTLPLTWAHPEREARGVWLTGGELLASTETLLRKLDALQAANFNEVMVDTWFRGFVPYPDSKIAPQIAEAAGRDPVAWVVSEIQKRGMTATAWPEYGFYAYYAKNPQQNRSLGPILEKHPHLTALNSAGEAAIRNPALGNFYSLCPANPESHQLLADLIVEQMARYPFAGLNLDRMRFPSSDYCHCAWCKEQFQKDTRLELKKYPDQSAEARKFLEWKREQNARSVARVTEAVRKARPDAHITAYVVGPEEKDDKAQSWELWVERNLVDAVAVSMYGIDISSAARKAIELLGGSDRLIAAINAEQPPNVYLSNLGKARTFTQLGQYTWYAGQVLDDADNLTTGPYAKPAASPFSD